MISKKKLDITNPKDLAASNKVSLTKFPAVALVKASMALMDGAQKYGSFNWRGKDVIASVYIDAALRHLYCWFEGQEDATDSKVHHLGHAIACCAILLDAQATGHFVDDRPLDRRTGKEQLDWMNRQARRGIDDRNDVIDPDWMEEFLLRCAEDIKAKREKHA